VDVAAIYGLILQLSPATGSSEQHQMAPEDTLDWNLEVVSRREPKKHNDEKHGCDEA